MKKITLFIILFSFLIITSIMYFGIFRQNITGGAVLDYYTYTKAICDENNYCQDYEIVCINGELANMNPLTGMAVQQDPDWEDPRNESDINRLCD